MLNCTYSFQCSMFNFPLALSQSGGVVVNKIRFFHWPLILDLPFQIAVSQ